MHNQILNLPHSDEEQLETHAVLKKTVTAHRYLAELKGVSLTIPNEAILINTLTLQEAKDSSEVENIITTQDDLFKAALLGGSQATPEAKEVQDYVKALRYGFSQTRKNHIIRLVDILAIQETLGKNRAGLQKLPGTTLKNIKSGEVIYTPPQDPAIIEALINNLVDFINDDKISELDPLIKMALIHHQFESIHPFYDGNGRTGRIINVLYLVTQQLMHLPVLYLSRYFIQDKNKYYQQLQEVRDSGNWENWLLYILEGVAQTSQQSILLIKQIKLLMQHYKQEIRTKLPKIYSQELLNNLFKHPYTKIDFVVDDLRISRLTAGKYLDQLVQHDFLIKQKHGRSNYYINVPLLKLFTETA